MHLLFLTQTNHFNSHFPGQPGLASCPTDFPSYCENPHKTGQNVLSYPYHTLVGYTVPTYINCHPKGFWSRF